MRKGFLEDIHPFGKLIISLVIALSILFFFFGISILIAIPVFHIHLDDLQTLVADIDSMSNTSLLKFFQIFQSIGFFIIPPFIIAWFIAAGILSYLGLLRLPRFSSIILSILIVLAGVPVINYLGNLNASMKLPGFMSGLENWMMEKESEFGILTEKLLLAHDIPTLLLNIFMIAIIPALGEELTFRGILQQLLTEWTRNTHWGVIITAFIFSAIHFQFYGFLPRFALGLFLGYLFAWSRSLWLPVVAHFANNCAAVIFYYLAGKNWVDASIENIGTEGNLFYTVMISTGLITILMMLIYRIEKLRSLDI